MPSKLSIAPQRLDQACLYVGQRPYAIDAAIAGNSRMGGDVILIKRDQRFGLRVIDPQAIAHGVVTVVGALYQRLAGDIVETLALRRIGI